MTLHAVFFDFGGVIVRTEYQAPRERLAERLNMNYEDLVKLVFESQSSRQASVGAISVDEHWRNVIHRLGLPDSQIQPVRDEFFAGDFVDYPLLDFIRSMRPRCKTGLISNAWGDLREYVVRQGFDDAFDHIVVSAEVGTLKPEARIYQIALEQAGVRADEAAFVDDTPENVAGAQAVGMRGIVFREPQEALAKLKRLLDGK